MSVVVEFMLPGAKVMQWTDSRVPLTVEVSWDETGCAHCTIGLSEVQLPDALSLEWGTFPALPFTPVAVALDGQVIWDGYVESVIVNEDGVLTGIEARGWTAAPLGYAIAGSSEPIGAVGQRLIREFNLPLELIFESSVNEVVQFAGAWSDWCERVRHVASDRGRALLVQSIPERLILVREQSRIATPELLAPKRFRRTYPSARDIATLVVARAATAEAQVRNKELYNDIGFEVVRVLQVSHEATAAELQRVAQAELDRSDFLPSCQWSGREPWQSVTGEFVPVWELRPGQLVLAPRIGLLQIQSVQLELITRRATVTFGRPAPDQEVLKALAQVVSATSVGRSAVTWA